MMNTFVYEELVEVKIRDLPPNNQTNDLSI
jgi:hypothetical protein